MASSHHALGQTEREVSIGDWAVLKEIYQISTEGDKLHLNLTDDDDIRTIKKQV